MKATIRVPRLDTDESRRMLFIVLVKVSKVNAAVVDEVGYGVLSVWRWTRDGLVCYAVEAS